MARRFARRRRRKVSTDWISAIPSYSMGLAPIILPDGTFFVNPLTYYRDLTLPAASVGVPVAQPGRYYEQEVTTQRCIGSIWCWILPSTAWWSTLTGRTTFIVRIVKLKQFIFAPSSDATTITPNVADLRAGAAGQEEFLWEHVEVFVAQSMWGSLTIDPTMYVRRVDFDVRVKRRLEKGEVLAIHMQYGGGIDYAGDSVTFPDLAVDVRMRTLVSPHP